MKRALLASLAAGLTVATGAHAATCTDNFNRANTPNLGQPTACSNNYATSGLGTTPTAWTGGIWNGAYTTGPGTVSYASLPLPAPISHITATIGITNGAANGNAIVLLISTTPLQNVWTTISAQVHLVIENDRWYTSIIPSGVNSERVLAGGFYPPLSGEYPVSVDVHGTTETIQLPNGATKRVNDPALGQLTGTWATAEVVNYNPGALYFFDSWTISN